MKECPYCGADIEGLVRHCDLCGAPIITKPESFILHTFTAFASVDLPIVCSSLFKSLNNFDLCARYDFLHCVEVNVYCYPEEMLEVKKDRTRVRYYSSRKRAVMILELNYNAFVQNTKQGKRQLVCYAVRDGFGLLHKTMGKRAKDISDLVAHIDLIMA